jgi:excisionase family DNA binding protein
MDKILLTTQEAADFLGIGRAKLYEYLGREIPVVRIGRAVRVHIDDARRFADAMRDEARKGDAA